MRADVAATLRIFLVVAKADEGTGMNIDGSVAGRGTVRVTVNRSLRMHVPFLLGGEKHPQPPRLAYRSALSLSRSR